MTRAIAVRGELDRYVAEVSRHPLLSREEEQSLARRFRDDGDVAAAHTLVVSNLRFVVKVAHQYRGYGIKLLDLVQEGNIGLMQAVKKFDPDKGYRLISYAVWWIRASIQSYVMKTWSMVKLGSGRVRRKLFFKLRSERSKMQQQLGSHEGSDSDMSVELAKRLGVSESDLSEMEVRLAGRDYSLDAPVAEDAGVTHVDMLSGEVAADQEAVAIEREEHELLNAALENVSDDLDVKERMILDTRLLNDEPRTLAEIGDELGVTRERVRQIEKKLIGKIREAVQVESRPALTS